MTYTEWRDELKDNLLTVSEAERRRVLDYYAEAYADRREAGFGEREIIEGFGAPYDAAQRILSENSDEYYRDANRKETIDVGREMKNSACESRCACHSKDNERRVERESEYSQSEYHSEPKPKQKSNGGWVFVLLCVIFAIPIFAVIMAMIGITIGLCVAPFSVVGSGIGVSVAGFGTLFVNASAGTMSIGAGIVVIGVGLMLFPLCFKLVKWMWKLFNMFFHWLKNLCSGGKAS